MNRSATTESTIIPNIHHDNIKTVNQYEDDYRRKVITSYDNLSYHKQIIILSHDLF